MKSIAMVQAPVIQKRNLDAPRVLSSAQQRLWYLHQLAPESPAYNTPFMCRLSGALNEAALENALNGVVERHEVLRTVILVSNGAPVPFPLKKRPVSLKQTDLRHLPDHDREGEAHRLIREEAAKPFQLARESLFRAGLFRLSDDQYIFFHDAPHIVFEGGSLPVLYREIAVLYNAAVCGTVPDVPDLTIQYSDFAAWQRQAVDGERFEKTSRFWRERLSGAATMDLPLDFPRPAVHTIRGRRRFFSIPPGVLSAADALFKAVGTTPYRGLLAAFNVFLHCYSGLTDISVGSPFAPRCRGIENLIGFFVNTVVLRTDLSGDPTFVKLIRRTDAMLHRAIMHSDLTFDRIVEAVQPPRDPSRTPLFQVNFRAPNQPYPSLQLDGVTAQRAMYVDNGTAKFDLALEVDSSTGEACYFEYCSDLFKEATIVRMEADFVDLLAALIAAPETPISEVGAVTDISERVRATSRGLRRSFACTAI